MSKWYKASELERLKTLTARDGVNGLPDNHVITVSERTIGIDERELVQNNVSTDTYTLELDAEWDDITPVVIFSNSEGDYKVAYENGPTKIPAAVMAVVGAVDVSVFGLDSTGEVRVVTKAAPNTMTVVESGKFVGEISEDDVSLLGQILAAAEAANKAAENANSTAENAGTTVEQLKESVKTFLSQSQTSVDNAVSSAGTATQAANTATQKANTAADNADNSADAADTAAASAKAAASRAENAYTTLQPVLSDISVSGNQPRTTLSGNVVSANDAWPAKPLGIKIKGKTRQNLWVNHNRATSGITIASNDDGSITLSGTSTSDSDLYVAVTIYTIKPNTTYTLSVDKQLNGFSIYTQEYNADGFVANCLAINNGDMSMANTATTSKSGFDRVKLFIRVAPGATVSGTYRVMLNEGATAEPWCPPGLNSVDELSLVTAGKNLFDYTKLNSMWFGAGQFASGSYVMQLMSLRDWWTDNAGNNYSIYWYLFKDAAAATAAAAATTAGGGGGGKISGFIQGGGATFIGSTVGSVSSAKFSLKYPGYLLFIYYGDTKFVGEYVDDVQIELGSTATDYEPPTVTTTPINLDGNSLRSLPDGTCDELTVDTNGAVTLTQRVGACTVDGSENWSFDTNRIGARVLTENSADILVSHNAYCDTLPVRRVAFSSPSIISYTTNKWIDIRHDAIITDAQTGKSWLSANNTTLLYPLATPKTIELDAITPPLLPGPNLTAFANTPVPVEMELEYVRDINEIVKNLEAQIADLVTKEAANV